MNISFTQLVFPNVRTSFFMMASLADQPPQEHDEMRQLLLVGYDGLKRHSESIPEEVRTELLLEAVKRLIELYTAVERPEEMEKWMAERERIGGGSAGGSEPLSESQYGRLSAVASCAIVVSSQHGRIRE